MARDQLFPYWLSEVHARKKIPLKALWFQSGVAVFFISVGTFREILLFSGFILILFSTLTVSVLFKISNYRVLPAIFIGINLIVLFNAFLSKPWESLAGLIMVILGIPVYFFYKRRISEPGSSELAG